MRTLAVIVALVLCWLAGFLVGASRSFRVEYAVDPGDYTVILDPQDGGGYTAKFVRPGK